MAEKAVSLERLKRYFAKEKEVFAAKSHTHSDATTSSHGMMSAADKTKLNGIAAGANDYSHPTSSGNKHIPAGGASGQILRWASDGTAQWGNDNNTTYSAMKGASATANGSTGLVPAPTMGNQGKYLRADGTWQTPPDTNTTYGTATQSANGLMSAADKKKLDNLALTLFPVGSVVITHTNTNPGTYIGGTWVAYAPGRVLVGVGTGNDGSKSVTFGTGTGGEYAHKLSVA
ncbi:phage baseplate protein, partial [Faecalibaculum rodentium]